MERKLSPSLYYGISFLLLFVGVGCMRPKAHSLLFTCTTDCTGTSTVRVVSESQAIPANLPSGTNFADMSFDLSEVSTDLSGVTFKITIQSYQPDTSKPAVYRFKEPRLVTPTKSIRVEDILVLVNGLEKSSTEFQEVGTTVSPANDPPLLSSLTVTADMIDAANDQISISFGKLAKGTALACKHLSTFENSVQGMSNSTVGTMAHSCFGCHQNTSNPAHQFFAMDVNSATLCAKSLQRVNLTTIAHSQILLNPKNGYNDMPVVGDFSSNWSAWIQSEAP